MFINEIELKKDFKHISLDIGDKTEQAIDVKTLWKAVKAELQLIIEPSYYNTWVSSSNAEKKDEHTIKIICSNELAKSRMETKFSSLISDLVFKIDKRKYHFEFVVEKAKQSSQTNGEIGPLFAEEMKPRSGKSINDLCIKSGLNPKYAFENYVTGTNNQLAFAIASAVADNPGNVYNPVFFYSGVGLGKTHLIQAIGRRILEKNPNAKIIYCTGENFTNELIESLQSGKGGMRGKQTQNEFRDKYRKVDILLIDDIQFITGKEATQEEFFHTFNALHQNQKQVVLTSDCPPKDLKNISERIKSRFRMGVIADIQAAALETREAILRNKRDLNRDAISNDVIDFIAQKVTSNIRELEGAYLQVVTYCKSLGLEYTRDNAAAALGQSIREETSQAKPINLNIILKAVCTYYSVKSADIKGQKRTKDLVIPRQVAMYLIKDLTETPLMSIGEFLGGRDHTTIMHGVRRVGEDVSKLDKVRQDVANIKQLIYA